MSQAFGINPNPKQGIGISAICTVSAGTGIAASTRPPFPFLVLSISSLEPRARGTSSGHCNLSRPFVFAYAFPQSSSFDKFYPFFFFLTILGCHLLWEALRDKRRRQRGAW